jgi:hypothetical protein
MDIVRIIKWPQFRASFATLALKQKLFLIIFLISLIATLVPHETSAAFLVTVDYKPVLVFDTQTTDYQNYLVQISQEATDRYHQQYIQAQALRQQKLTEKITAYLKQQNSPLADYTQVLVTLKNWKKIVALASAESSMCRNYPTGKANCWGVGGTNLWDMGNNLGQGIVSMNHFLNQYPKGLIKYSQMSFERMNGLYKQPPADHWVYNSTSVYNDLAAIERNI